MAPDRWTPMFALPDVHVDDPIEHGPAALVQDSDPRVLHLRKKHKTFDVFLKRFTDAFQVESPPAVLLLKTSAPATMRDVEALAGFRNAVAISAISRTYAKFIANDTRRGAAPFSDFFAFYPWMLGKDYEHFIAQTPAALAVHDVEEFHGQTTPGLHAPHLTRFDLDQPLLEALLKQWKGAYSKATEKRTWKEIALFRSLNMACHAASMPGRLDALHWDVGRLISLWISAFEILVHPGKTGSANLSSVCEHLDAAPWQKVKLQEKIYPVGKKKTLQMRTFASSLYKELYDRRNDYLHGNPLPENGLKHSVSGELLHRFAPLLYRMALTVTLPLKTKASPASESVAKMANYLAWHMSFVEPQKDIEKALLKALPTKDHGAQPAT